MSLCCKSGVYCRRTFDNILIMQNLTATFCLTIALLLGSTGQPIAQASKDKPSPKWTTIQGRSDCSIWNRMPQDQEQVFWNGNCKNGKAHGEGTLTYRFSFNSTMVEEVYRGSLRNGKNHGYGEYTWSGGDVYAGEFNDSDITGLGTWFYNTGKKYVGEVRNGSREGLGMLTGKDFHVAGEFRDEKLKGLTIVTLPDPNTQSDQPIRRTPVTIRVVEDFKTKRILQKFYVRRLVKDKIFGSYRLERAETKIITFGNGDKYVGGLENGKRHGHGVYIESGGSKYVGEFDNNQYSGLGIILFKDGNKYVGPFKYGIPHGKGVATEASGETYIGKFRRMRGYKRGTVHFDGTITNPNGQVEEVESIMKFQHLEREKSDDIQSVQSDLGDILINAYFSYIQVKECNKQNSMYISSREVKTSRSQIARIESYLKGKDKTLDTESTWNAASKKWENSSGKLFRVGSLTGQYNQQLKQMCRLSYMQLNSVQIPGTQKKRTKDF